MSRSWLDQILAAYLRSPEHPAKYRIVRCLGRWIFPHDGIVAPVEPGVLLRLHPRDWIEYVLLRDGRYELATLRFLQRNLAPGDRALLAGVSFGLHVIVAARAVGPSGRIIGVEPQPAALLRARDNLRLNDLEEVVQLVPVGLGRSSAFVPIAPPPADNSGRASLLDAPSGCLMTQVVPLSSLLASLEMAALRLLLLDVEGCELQALDGLEGGPRPDLLVVENEPPLQEKAGAGASALPDRLAELGYELFDLGGHPFAGERQLEESNLVAVRAGAAVSWS